MPFVSFARKNFRFHFFNISKEIRQAGSNERKGNLLLLSVRQGYRCAPQLERHYKCFWRRLLFRGAMYSLLIEKRTFVKWRWFIPSSEGKARKNLSCTSFNSFFPVKNCIFFFLLLFIIERSKKLKTYFHFRNETQFCLCFPEQIFVFIIVFILFNLGQFTYYFWVGLYQIYSIFDCVIIII